MLRRSHSNGLCRTLSDGLEAPSLSRPASDLVLLLPATFLLAMSLEACRDAFLEAIDAMTWAYAEDCAMETVCEAFTPDGEQVGEITFREYPDRMPKYLVFIMESDLQDWMGGDSAGVDFSLMFFPSADDVKKGLRCAIWQHFAKVARDGNQIQCYEITYDMGEGARS